MKGLLICTLVIVATATLSSAQQWRKARLTHYTSYPECCDDPGAPDQEECDDYNGCKWKGQFAYVDGQKSLEWVKSHNIIAVHSKDSYLKLKTLEIRKNGKTIQGVVYDHCSDSDCNGCCTRNAGSENFLIDLEKYTYQRFGQRDGVVEWRCVNC